MNICVSNVSPATSLSDLRGCFEIYGEVTRATISTYKVEGKPRRMGTIQMPFNHHGLAAVAALHGRELDGAMITVREE